MRVCVLHVCSSTLVEPAGHQWLFQCCWCDLGVRRAQTSQTLKRHRLRACLVAAVGSHSFCPLTSSAGRRMLCANLCGMVWMQGELTAGVWKHPLCFKLHVRTVELIQILAPALLEVCQTRLRYVHSVLTDFEHISNMFDESALAVYQMSIRNLVQISQDRKLCQVALWEMYFHFIYTTK